MTDEIRLKETTLSPISERQVGVGNIFERDLPDAKGVIARRLSAILVVHDPASEQTHRETVIVESVITIGADKYCVVAIDEGDRLGWVSLRKLAP